MAQLYSGPRVLEGDMTDIMPIRKQTQPKLDEILKVLEKTKFHGNITVHYLDGQPRKIEYKSVEDLNT